MKGNKVVVAVVILIILGVGLYAGMKVIKKVMRTLSPEATPAVTQTITPSAVSSTTAATTSATQSTTMVSITSNSFSPKTVTIKIGETVSWTNNDSVNHTVNSAVHPTHQVYPLLNLGLIQPGSQKSLTFPTAGTYQYHDHLNPSLTGTVVVQ